mmetsp:Transcript_42305/g.75794  ORF Transcript_42305/g.75794 Transcript_42305/m.75794 type:complete len:229 (-) Transcript_42305:425-1111(-)
MRCDGCRHIQRAESLPPMRIRASRGRQWLCSTDALQSVLLASHRRRGGRDGLWQVLGHGSIGRATGAQCQLDKTGKRGGRGIVPLRLRALRAEAASCRRQGGTAASSRLQDRCHLQGAVARKHSTWLWDTTVARWIALRGPMVKKRCRWPRAFHVRRWRCLHWFLEAQQISWAGCLLQLEQHCLLRRVGGGPAPGLRHRGRRRHPGQRRVFGMLRQGPQRWVRTLQMA